MDRNRLKLSLTANGKEGKSNVTVSCKFLEGNFKKYSEEGVGLVDSVETLVMDPRTRTKKLGAKEKARRRTCDVKVASAKKNHSFKKNYMKVEVRKLLRTGLVPARVWGGQALGMPLDERLKLRRQMAAVAGKKSSTSSPLFS